LYLEEISKTGIAHSTLLGYKSCVCETLRLALDDDSFSKDATLASFLKGIKPELAKVGNPVPKWDLQIVLRGLRMAPFEPLEQASLQLLTYKALFLTALASAARVSELGALSVADGHVRFKEDDSEVTLLPFDGFLAKNQRTGEPPRSIVLKSLKGFTPDDDPELLLCPVRALQLYLRATRGRRGTRQRLFISYSVSTQKDITSQTLSRYLRETIQRCYQGQAPALVEHCHAHAHEVRAIASSTLLWKSNSVENVLRAAGWKSHNTFSTFYFRNMTHVVRPEGTTGGGAVVAGHRMMLNI